MSEPGERRRRRDAERAAQQPGAPVPETGRRTRHEVPPSAAVPPSPDPASARYGYRQRPHGASSASGNLPAWTQDQPQAPERASHRRAEPPSASTTGPLTAPLPPPSSRTTGPVRSGTTSTPRGARGMAPVQDPRQQPVGSVWSAPPASRPVERAQPQAVQPQPPMPPVSSAAGWRPAPPSREAPVVADQVPPSSTPLPAAFPPAIPPAAAPASRSARPVTVVPASAPAPVSRMDALTTAEPEPPASLWGAAPPTDEPEPPASLWGTAPPADQGVPDSALPWDSIAPAADATPETDQPPPPKKKQKQPPTKKGLWSYTWLHMLILAVVAFVLGVVIWMLLSGKDSTSGASAQPAVPVASTAGR